MAANLLVLDVLKTPISIIELNSGFNNGVFNNNKTKRLLSGYAVDESENIILPKTLCHDDNYLLYLCRGESDPESTVQSVINDSYELKVSDYLVMREDISSEWYRAPMESY
mgnify:CR=1 FL=1|tara:strand:- start:3390 stop:3722 length:333 start_codon:yes stop_codon:yes gene_type:complete